MHLTTLLFHPSLLYSKLMKKQANIMFQRYQKCYRGTYFNDVIYISSKNVPVVLPQVSFKASIASHLFLSCVILASL